MFKQKTWFFKRRTQLYLGSSEMTSSFSKFKGSIFAIIFGLIIACFVIIGSGQNAITYFQLLLTYAFTSWPANNWDNTLVWWAVYIVAGLALVVSFRTGMFNIGVAGQMLAAGAVVIAIGVRYNLSQPITIIFAMLAAVLAAILVALTTVLLKVWFNVHEVVTSILLNWTIWYLIKWLFKGSKDLYDQSHGTTTRVHENMSMNIGGYNCILPLLIAGVLVFLIWFLLKKTTLGYKVRTVGLNPNAATYAGINNKRYSIISFAISGALAGVMAVIYYIAKNPSISFLSDDLPTIGFDSIAVALVGQINPFGVVGSSFLWGLIKSGGSIGTVLQLPNATGDIIFGVIIYSAACAVLLSRIQPVTFLIRYCNIMFNHHKRKMANSYLIKMYDCFINTFKIKKEYNQQINELKIAINKKKQLAIKQLTTKSLAQIGQYRKEKHELQLKIKQVTIKYQDQLKLLKQQTITNNNQIKSQTKITNDQFKIKNNQQLAILKKTYKLDNKELVKAKKQINNLIMKLKQQLKKNIADINGTIDLNLQTLVNTRIDKVGVMWAQIAQTRKALNHYMYKQYNLIWKKGKLGIWNNVHKQKKVVYGESLNTYINEKMEYEKNVYNYKQQLKQELGLLNKQKIVIKKNSLKDLKQQNKIVKLQIQKQIKVTLASLKSLTLAVKTTNQPNLQTEIDFKKASLKDLKQQLITNQQKLKTDLLLLKQQLKPTILPINKTINTIKQQFIKKVAFEKKTFYDKFKQLIISEQKTIIEIKPEMIGGKK